MNRSGNYRPAAGRAPLLIQEQETLDIVPIFWDEEAYQDASPAILSMRR